MVDDNREADNNLTTTERVSVQTDTRTGGEELSPSSPPQTQDRNALLDCARTFLKSPDVVHEDPTTKRRFLTDKGLREDEIDGLMRELPPRPPPVPPRVYPQPPPSNLPRLLLGLTKILSWLTGGSAALIFIYYRFLLPRITHSAVARRSLKQHQVSLLKRLNTSLAELKASQAETHAVLPAPSASYEPKQFAEFHKLEKLGIERDTPIEVPEFTLLRCTIEGLLAEGKKATKEELFALLEERFSWLKTDEGLTYQNSLWEKLTTYPCFSESDENNRLVWTYTAPTPPDPTPLLTSLTSLKSSFPPARTEPSAIQRALDTLADFTGYITTQTYQLAAGSMRLHAGHGYSTFGAPSQLTPQQEEVKKDIRALKGLVLNRRTFAPTATRATSYTPASVTP
ncbi:hypothetical protein ACEPAF_6761 [Sanghuangporus sanghuang]